METLRPDRTAVDGLVYPECPRWHEDSSSLLFSDQHAKKVLRLFAASGQVQVVCSFLTSPSGLGFLGDDLLVVSMQDRKVLRLNNWQKCADEQQQQEEEKRSLSCHSDLFALTQHHANDMLVTESGRAYVGNFGFDYLKGLDNQVPACLVKVEADGRACEATAKELVFPNGMALINNGETLIVAETFAARLAAFDVDENTGALTNRRIWAQFKDVIPDGICADSQNGVWIASARGNRAVRVEEGGQITHQVLLEKDRNCYACELGGLDGKTLFLMTAVSSRPDVATTAKSGRVEVVMNAPFPRIRRERQRVFVVRHGPCAYKQGVVTLDEANDLTDEEPVKRTGQLLRRLLGDQASSTTILSSPFGRCLQTARILSGELSSSSAIETDVRLNELEGIEPATYRKAIAEILPDVKTAEQYAALSGRELQQRIHELTPSSRAFVEQLESIEDAGARLFSVVQEHVQRKKSCLIVVTHCGLLTSRLGRMQEKGAAVEVTPSCVPISSNDSLLNLAKLE